MAITKKPAPKKVAAKKAKPKVTAKVVRETRPPGRPSKYKPEFAEQVYKLCLLGATDEKMADFFGVNPDTFHEWKKVHSGFSESITRGKEGADAEIAQALFHRAKGYSHPEDDIRTVSFGPGGSEIVITPTTKHYPPDTPAASLWLRNRQPKIWRDKVEVEQKVDVEHAGSVDVNATIGLSDPLARALDALAGAAKAIGGQAPVSD